VIAGGAQQALVKKELKQLAGDWKSIKGEADGNAYKGGDDIIIEGDKLSLLIRGRITFVGKIKLDPTKTPKTIDWHLTEGPGPAAGKIKPGIYKLEGGKLEICWNPENSKERPKKFTTQPTRGRGFQYAQYERKKTFAAD
jgi:uncharacterized protein (TIGR03067 family)